VEASIADRAWRKTRERTRDGIRSRETLNLIKRLLSWGALAIRPWASAIFPQDFVIFPQSSDPVILPVISTKKLVTVSLKLVAFTVELLTFL
jgi:hypothetical protein